MQGKRLHNILFVLSIAAVFAVTAWSVFAREPELIDQIPQIQIERSTPQKSAPAEEKVKEEIKDEKGKKIIEQLIERGELSKHPARYYQKVQP